MTKIYTVVFPLLILLCFSCKKEMPVSPGFELSASPDNNTVVLNWPPVYLSGFKSITIYRSVSPIPDPLFNRPIDASLLIGTVADKTITTYKDSNLVLGSGGTVYYKIVMNLADRIIPSNEVQTSLDGFSITYNSNGFPSSTILTIPEKNLLYILNNNASTISVFDYSQKKLLKTASLNQWGNVYPIMNGGNAEIFVRNNVNISCYDGLTLLSKYSINIPYANYVRDFKVKDNYMYVLYFYGNYVFKISTYDLSTQAMVNQKIVYYSNTNSACNLYVGSQSNSLFFKYRSETYQNGYNVYKNLIAKYNIVNNLPADSIIISNPLLNPDSINYSYSYYDVLPSPDGNYITCNTKGDILSLADNSIHNVQSGSNFTPQIVYSTAGNYLLAKPIINGVTSSNLIDVFSLPNFNLVASVKSPNPTLSQGSSSMIKDDFLDNDSLVSYNLKHTILQNQTKSVLTVFFKKFN